MNDYLKAFSLWIFLFFLSSCLSDKKTSIPVVETVNITQITQNSALSGGVIISDGGLNITTKGVCWGDKTKPDLQSPHTSDGSGIDPFTSSLTGLKSDTEYFARAYAVNSEGTSYGFEKTFRTLSIESPGQIVANHTIVDKYDQIPQAYIDLVKKMLVEIGGESHSGGYRIGANLLELLDSRFQVLTYDGSTPVYSDQNLRLGRPSAMGEETYYTSQAAVNNFKNRITSLNNPTYGLSAFGFGWCYDMTWVNAPGGTEDPVYGVRWAGTSVGGADGNARWGLDAGDYALTGNRVCMDTYLDAFQQYTDYCVANGYITRAIFTTGPVDGDGGTETGYQREVKHDYIRAYIAAHPATVLFDYADILCWNNSGEKNIVTWNDGGILRPHAQIHPDNLKDYDASWNIITGIEDGDHIGEVGTLRLAKAMWWMLARIAGWDGSSSGTKNN